MSPLVAAVQNKDEVLTRIVLSCNDSLVIVPLKIHNGNDNKRQHGFHTLKVRQILAVGLVVGMEQVNSTRLLHQTT